MIRKSHGTDAKACCFSIPLLLKPDGTKFGKSEGGAIYLDPELTSPYTMYQFLLSQPDSMIETMLKRFTFLDEETIGKIIAEHKSEPSKFYGQKVLAKTVVTDIHGADEANKSIKISDALFSGNMSALSSDELYDALSGTNVFTATKKEYPTYELLVEAKICKSNSEARKLIEQKGISLNGKALDKNDTTITANNSIDNKFSYIKRGKKDYTLIK
jgi:tyrosyl-tRNA synthetase